MVKMHKEKVRTAIEFIGQCVSEPMLPDKLLKKEIGIIQQEIKYYEDDPMSKAHSEMERLVYTGSNLGRDIAGTIETVSSMTREKLEAYSDKYFVASNMIVGVVGEYENEEELLSLIRKEFKPVLAKKSDITKDLFVVPEQIEARVSLVSRKIEQANLFIGFRSFGRGYKDYFARSLMDIVLGRSLFSRLFLEIREKRGWAYVIASGTDSYRDVGNLYMEAGLPNKKLKDASELMLEMAYGLGGGNKWKITQKELEIAKECFKGRLAMKFDSPERVLESVMDDLLYEGKIKTPEMILNDVEGVSLKTVHRIANETFIKEKLNLAVVGNYKKLPMKL
jgi:predicted Zn-dependent peptidase